MSRFATKSSLLIAYARCLCAMIPARYIASEWPAAARMRASRAQVDSRALCASLIRATRVLSRFAPADNEQHGTLASAFNKVSSMFHIDSEHASKLASTVEGLVGATLLLRWIPQIEGLVRREQARLSCAGLERFSYRYKKECGQELFFPSEQESGESLVATRTPSLSKPRKFGLILEAGG